MPPLLLLVDDAPEVLAIVRILGRRSGQEIVCHADPKKILDRVRDPLARPPDLLLIDLHLPGENGVEFYRRLLKEVPALEKVPAALFTQGASASALANALDAGMDFIVSKELLADSDAWKARIDEVLRLAVIPPQRPESGLLDARRLAEGVWRALLDPVLSRFDEVGLRALWRRASLRSGGATGFSQSDIDVPLSSGSLARDFSPLVSSCPDVARRLVSSLSYQVECVLGRAAGEPVCTALMAALTDAASP